MAGAVTADDEIRFLKNALRLLRDDVQTRLLDHGWAVTDLDVGDDEPLEWFWPPTAPFGYGQPSEEVDEAIRGHRQTDVLGKTPWSQPTRITRAESCWRVKYGTAITQKPDSFQDYAIDEDLLADLERIEWWPMPVDGARRIRMERVNATTTADAHDNHSVAVIATEPYASRLRDLRAHILAEDGQRLSFPDVEQPSTPRPRGDLRARCRLVDAEAWASAIRTARAGGDGWGINGLEG